MAIALGDKRPPGGVVERKRIRARSHEAGPSLIIEFENNGAYCHSSVFGLPVMVCGRDAGVRTPGFMQVERDEDRGYHDEKLD